MTTPREDTRPGGGDRTARTRRSVLTRLSLSACLLVLALTAAANVLVVARTSDAVVHHIDQLLPAQVAIVPGSFVRADGTMGRVVAERVDAAVRLHAAGVVDKVLVSGDHGTASYDEPGAMRDALLRAGVPATDVFTDHAGFSTWHTMRRAHDIFGVASAVVVTQDTYVARSVDLARAAGIEVQGYIAGDAGRGYREVLARVRGLGEATWTPGVTGGPQLPIDGHGPTSWGAPDVSAELRPVFRGPTRPTPPPGVIANPQPRSTPGGTLR